MWLTDSRARLRPRPLQGHARSAGNQSVQSVWHVQKGVGVGAWRGAGEIGAREVSRGFSGGWRGKGGGRREDKFAT